MTGCVSYFTLGPCSAFSGSTGVFLYLTWPVFWRTSWQLFFIYLHMGCKIDLIRLKAVISNFQWVKKRPVPPPQGETLGASDTFNIQEKRYWFLGLNERKFGLKTIKNPQNQRRNRKLFFIDLATARYGTTPVVAESQRKFNSILRYRVACSFCESQFYLADRKYNSRRNMFARTNFFQSENLIYCRGLIIAIFKRPCARNTSETKLRDITVCKTRCR